ncbi:MAG: hypothetical protein LQ346_004600 [Caloplaca aetnensis]|nr:MAG: hypothetical protein LQ346_004600 [Caloplaca aetnensis]
MSLDLLQAFGGPSHEELANPWATASHQNSGDPRTTEEDDFGDFEEPEWPVQPLNQAREHSDPTLSTDIQPGDLLIDTSTGRPQPSPSFPKANAPLKLVIPPKTDDITPTDVKPIEPTPITSWPSYGRARAKSVGESLPLSPFADDDWGDFEEEAHEERSTAETAGNEAPQNVDASEKAAERTGSLLDHADVPQEQSLEPAAPSNIPPPSVLLSVVVNNLHSLSTRMRDTVSATSVALMSSENPDNDAVLENLTAQLAIIKASARVASGRKLRWKRDKILAQSMSIGPANAGRSGGMKLTGIDRTEIRREDQEAAEVVRLWKQQVGSVKSFLAQINAQQSEVNFVLPDISENVPIRTAKAGEGAVTATKCCFLCGLKRDERVARLDVNVEDSFSEWWADHWGHVDCICFWREHKDSLKQR